MARILSRAAGRLLTGPLAVLLAALIDLAAFAFSRLRSPGRAP